MKKILCNISILVLLSVSTIQANKIVSNTIFRFLPLVSDSVDFFENEGNAFKEKIRTCSLGTRLEVCNDVVFVENKSSKDGMWLLRKGRGHIWDPLKNKTLITDLAVGENVFDYGTNENYEKVVIYNHMEKAFAGKDQVICQDYTQLHAEKPKFGIGVWSVLSGSVHFIDKENCDTRIQNIQHGENILKWTVYYAGCHSSSLVRIINNSISVQVEHVKHVSCPENMDGALKINADFVTKSTKFQWGDNALETKAWRNNLAVGDYGVKVSNENCVDFTVATIGQNQKIEITQVEIRNPQNAKTADGFAAFEISGGEEPYAFFLEKKSGIPVPVQTSISNLKAGKYKFIVTDKNNCSCSRVFELKNLTETLEKPEIICSKYNGEIGKNYIYSTKTEAENYIWEVESGKIVQNKGKQIVVNWSQEAKNPIVKLTIESSQMKADTSLAISLNKKNSYNTPEVISPDGDGINDKFVFYEHENSDDFELVIFDTNGRIVYKKSPYNNDWNGVNNSGIKLKESTYHYFFQDKKNKTKQIRGTLKLVR